MEPATQICAITCEDGTEYPFFASVRARLIEVNDRLAKEPTLLSTKVGLVLKKIFFTHSIFA